MTQFSQLAFLLDTFRYSTSNPVILETCSDCAAFSSGQQPEWVQSTLTAVVMGYFPATATKGKLLY